jgi:hypothetical protein
VVENALYPFNFAGSICEPVFLGRAKSTPTGSAFLFLDVIFPILRHFFRHVAIVTLLAQNKSCWILTMVQVGLPVVVANFTRLTCSTLCHASITHPVLFRDG